MSGVQAVIAVGSNMDDPPQQVRSAVDALARLPATRLLDRSSLYQTPPWGVTGQDDYINAVALIETLLGAYTLLAALQALETDAGRSRGGHWQPRPLDLDIIVYGDLISADPKLTLPHPRAAQRAFVLLPLLEMAPTIALPGCGAVRSLLERLPTEEVDAIGRYRDVKMTRK